MAKKPAPFPGSSPRGKTRRGKDGIPVLVPKKPVRGRGKAKPPTREVPPLRGKKPIRGTGPVKPPTRDKQKPAKPPVRGKRKPTPFPGNSSDMKPSTGRPVGRPKLDPVQKPVKSKPPRRKKPKTGPLGATTLGVSVLGKPKKGKITNLKGRRMGQGKIAQRRTR